MRKYLIAFVVGLMLTGCSLPFLNKNKPVAEEKLPMPSVQSGGDIKSGNFYFNASDSGLVLMNTDNEEFSVKLSEQAIGEANIADGILTFTELLPEGGENMKVVNLEAYADSF